MQGKHGATSQHAIELGALIFNDVNDIRSILTEAELRKLQDSTLHEEMLWPSPYPADMTESNLKRPQNIPTEPID